MPRILIVDDNASLLSIYSIAMRREGYEVEVASDGESGLEQALTSDFDLILIDLSMPGISGTELASELRARNIQGRVALMTGLEIADLTESGLPYLLKPFDYTQLMQFVKGQFRKLT